MKDKLITQDQQKEKQVSNTYLLWAFGACLGFGTNNFVMGFLTTTHGLWGGLPICYGFTLIWFFYHLYYAVINLYKIGAIFDRNDSVLFNKQTHKFEFTQVNLINYKSLTTVLIYPFFFASQSFAALAGVN